MTFPDNGDSNDKAQCRDELHLGEVIVTGETLDISLIKAHARVRALGLSGDCGICPTGQCHECRADHL